MTVAELRELLEGKLVSRSLVCLNETKPTPVEEYVIEDDGHFWQVYYRERNERYEEHTFLTEDEACARFLSWLCTIDYLWKEGVERPCP